MKILTKVLPVFFILCIGVLDVGAQDITEHFTSLIGSKWRMEGKWDNGKSFKQEKEFSLGLEGKIVRVKTYGTINPQTGDFGLRNEGVRTYNAQTKQFEFYEFDVFGGVTSGTVEFEDGNIIYHYTYNGEDLTDFWEKVDEDTYKYKVGILEDGKWTKVYHTSEFVRVTD